jgi:pimeloyl-ACP methyl ester carboxylesterase
MKKDLARQQPGIHPADSSSLLPRTALTLFALGFGLLLSGQPAPACEDETPPPPANSRELFQGYKKDHGRRHSQAAPLPPGEQHGAVALRTAKEDCFFCANLRSEEDIPCLAPLARSYRCLPKETRRVETVRDGRKVRIAVTLVGSGRHDRVLVCIPGVMSDHREWRFVAGALGEEYDFWLIDPPGCGDSEAPDPKSLGPGGYSPSAMADREMQAIAACLADCPRPVQLVMVAHSLGGLVAIRAFADPALRARHGQTLARFEGMVALAPADVLMPEANQHFKDMSVLSGTKVSAASGLGLLRELVAQYLAKGFYCSRCLPREDVDNAVHVLTDKGHREAFQAMLRDALPFNLKTGQPDFREMQRLESWYQNVNMPVQIIWGNCDQTLPVHLGYKIARQLPNARLSVIPNCMHAPNLEYPELCARLVRQAELDLRSQARAAAKLGSAPDSDARLTLVTMRGR